jgi:methylated-DNA-[protein]-cysteine S-methyltransferase
MKKAYIYNTKIGRIFIAEDGLGITELSIFPEQEGNAMSGANQEQHSLDYEMIETELLMEAAKQLSQYLEGTRKEFTVELSPKGTQFQCKVWEALRAIPYGETRSYKQIAEVVGNPKASRAVGMANHYNPIMCIIPCHRVIGANGKLVGYAGGLNIKEALLNLEKKKG